MVKLLHIQRFSQIFGMCLQEKGSAAAFSYNESQPPVLLHPCLQGSIAHLLSQGKATSSCQHTTVIVWKSTHLDTEQDKMVSVIIEDQYHYN